MLDFVLIEKEPIITPNICRVVVPVAKPSANKKGFTAQGISSPWAEP